MRLGVRLNDNHYLSDERQNVKGKESYAKAHVRRILLSQPPHTPQSLRVGLQVEMPLQGIPA